MKKINYHKALEAAIFVAYGAMLLFLIGSGRINYFIHPGLQWLLIRVVGVFAVIGLLFLINFLFNRKKDDLVEGKIKLWKIVVLILPLLFGFLIKPSSLSAEQFWNRKGDENSNLILSRQLSDPPKFVFNSENRSLEDWIRLIAQMPDDGQFVGQKVKLTGFVVRDNQNTEIFYLSRYVLSCCAADARPIGLPIIYGENVSINENEWLEVKGEFEMMEMNGEENLLIKIQEFKRISEPENPYITQ